MRCSTYFFGLQVNIANQNPDTKTLQDIPIDVRRFTLIITS